HYTWILCSHGAAQEPVATCSTACAEIMTTLRNEPPPPPIVICPTEVDSINVTLEKNQQCACKDCGKLFNSVWYLKQHAVKHSNDRPFKCKFCFKTYKFRSNLYQHKCPDRQKQMTQGGRRRGGLAISPSARRLETNQLLKSRIESNMNPEDPAAYQSSVSDNEDNDLPITYGLVIQKLEEISQNSFPPNEQHGQSENINIETVEKQRPPDCVRAHPLPQEEIDAYIARNKSKAFECDRRLQRHSQVHAGVGPRRCEECFGIFRSPLALRRHLDQCRQCYIAPIQNEIMVSVHSPFDAFSFIPSESEGLFSFDDSSKDNGSGCDISLLGYHVPRRSSLPLDVDPFEMFASKKKDKEDDEDSGFRSRMSVVVRHIALIRAAMNLFLAPSCDVSDQEVPRQRLSPVLSVWPS
ncbi:zinc finger, C2H2 type, partial [Ancylostoma ceylanicum]